jgi:hypothetical protein
VPALRSTTIRSSPCAQSRPRDNRGASSSIGTRRRRQAPGLRRRQYADHHGGERNHDGRVEVLVLPDLTTAWILPR